MFAEDGSLIGKIRLKEIVTNLVFGSDRRLYLTLAHSIARVRVLTKPVRLMGKITKK